MRDAAASVDLNFESASEPEPEGLSAFAFGGIVFLVIWFWYGVIALYFYGGLGGSAAMVSLAALFTPLPCITICVLRWREIHNR